MWFVEIEHLGCVRMWGVDVGIDGLMNVDRRYEITPTHSPMRSPSLTLPAIYSHLPTHSYAHIHSSSQPFTHIHPHTPPLKEKMVYFVLLHSSGFFYDFCFIWILMYKKYWRIRCTKKVKKYGKVRKKMEKYRKVYLLLLQLGFPIQVPDRFFLC